MYKTEEGTARGLSLLVFYKRKSEIQPSPQAWLYFKSKIFFPLKKRSAYSSGMPALAQASRVALSHTLACTSPMWTLPSSSMHRRLWPMPPPMV